MVVRVERLDQVMASMEKPEDLSGNMDLPQRVMSEMITEAFATRPLLLPRF